MVDEIKMGGQNRTVEFERGTCQYDDKMMTIIIVNFKSFVAVYMVQQSIDYDPIEGNICKKQINIKQGVSIKNSNSVTSFIRNGNNKGSSIYIL